MSQLDLRIQVRTTTDIKTDPDPEEIIEEVRTFPFDARCVLTRNLVRTYQESKQWPSVYSRTGTPMAFAV